MFLKNVFAVFVLNPNEDERLAQIVHINNVPISPPFMQATHCSLLCQSLSPGCFVVKEVFLPIPFQVKLCSLESLFNPFLLLWIYAYLYGWLKQIVHIQSSKRNPHFWLWQITVFFKPLFQISNNSLLVLAKIPIHCAQTYKDYFLINRN